MDRAQGLSKNIFNKWESTFNAGSFLVAAATVSGTSLISWLKPTISKEGIFLTSLFNGSAVLLADKIAEKAGKKKTYTKTALTLFFLAASTFAAPYATVTLFAKTITEISSTAVCQIAFLNLIIKAVTYASYKLYESRLPSTPTIIPKTLEEINALSREEGLRIAKLLKQEDKKEWMKLDLPAQIAWNRHWHKGKAFTLLFTQFNPQVAISADDLIFIKEVNENDISDEFTQFLDVQKKMVFSSVLNKENVAGTQLDAVHKEVVKAPQSLVDLDAEIPFVWNIKNSDGEKMFQPGQFWGAVEEINDENIIKTITSAVALTNQFVSYQLLSNRKPYLLSNKLPPITVTVNNFTKIGKGCEIIIELNVVTSIKTTLEASTRTTFADKDSLDSLTGSIEYFYP